MTSSTIQNLMNQMTINEKIAQLVQLAGPFFKGSTEQGHITGPMAEMPISDDHIENAGSVLGVSGAKEVISIQKKHLENNRLGIPLLFMADIVHGYKTIFPVPLAIGCSWDIDLAQKSAEIAAKESAVSGVHVTFAPMVDLVRDPRWGRVMESTGEDPYLNQVFSTAFVNGFQGQELAKDLQSVAACVKHFAAYGASEAGRDYNTVDLSERQLREYYLPAYKAALDAGCEMVMTAFNTVDGIPATGNEALMRKLLREEWGFDGILISDWGAVKELIPHGVAEDEKEAALKAIKAGVDIEMMTACYVQHLADLVSEGIIEESLIDEAVHRILTLKEKLGLFDQPYRGADVELEKTVVGHQDHLQVAREIATKSSVLLKNDQHLLPLDKKKKVALIGPFADNNDILGPWSALGIKEEAITLKQAFEKQLPAEHLSICQGSDVEMINDQQIEEAIRVATSADVIVLALGESSDMSGEANSRTNIQLPTPQLKLIKALATCNKPIITILFNGRPLDLHGVVEYSNSILEAWYPGSQGGHALVELLYGEANPSGKLSMSFPENVGQVPVYYNHFNTGRPKDAPDAQIHYNSHYLDAPNEPMFPFGYGLSYSKFIYEDLDLTSNKLTPDTSITASVSVSNTSEFAGDEIVQFYIQDIAGEVVRPLKELKGFERISLKPGETKQVTFTINEEQLRYHHSDMRFKSDEGRFVLYAGTSSKEVLSQSFQFSKEGRN